MIAAAAIDRYVWYGSTLSSELRVSERHSGKRPRHGCPKGGGRRRRLTRMFTRCFADPTEFVLALREKRAERARIEQLSGAKNLICKKPGCHVGAPWEQLMRIHTLTHTPQEERLGVRQERHRTRTRNTRPPACSCAPRSRPHRQRPASQPACAAASAPSCATRRAAGAPAAHRRGRPGRGAAPRRRNTSVRRATRPLAFVRIRLRTSGRIYTHMLDIGGGMEW